MKQPIIPIQRASEALIESLINAGVLYVSADGLHVNENGSATADQSNTEP